MIAKKFELYSYEKVSSTEILRGTAWHCATLRCTGVTLDGISLVNYYYYYYYRETSVMQGWERVLDTLSVQRPKPDKTCQFDRSTEILWGYKSPVVLRGSVAIEEALKYTDE